MKEPPSPVRRLIVNADDFGRSSAINQAVIRAHREGILTTASLMVSEAATAEAVALAREHPKLGVGLHLTFLFGHSALPHNQVPGLTNAQREFGTRPTTAGLRFFFRRELHPQLRAEIRAQFERFRATGLKLDHVNGHLHLHLHPVILRVLMDESAGLGFDRLRVTADRFWLNLRLASGRWAYRASHALIFSVLARRARALAARRGVRHTQSVFGLLQDGRVDEAYVSRLLPRLPTGDSELYSHPSLDESKHELGALISPRVRGLVEELGIQLIRYQEL